MISFYIKMKIYCLICVPWLALVAPDQDGMEFVDIVLVRQTNYSVHIVSIDPRNTNDKLLHVLMCND